MSDAKKEEVCRGRRAVNATEVIGCAVKPMVAGRRIGTGKPAGMWGSTRTRTRGGCVPVPAGTGTGYPRVGGRDGGSLGPIGIFPAELMCSNGRYGELNMFTLRNTISQCQHGSLPGLAAYPRVTGIQLGYPYPYPRRVNPSTRAGYPYPCRCLLKGNQTPSELPYKESVTHLNNQGSKMSSTQIGPHSRGKRADKTELKNKFLRLGIISVLLELVAIGAFAGSLASFSILIKYPEYEDRGRFVTPATVWFGASAAADVAIALTLVWQLRGMNTGSKETRRGVASPSFFSLSSTISQYNRTNQSHLPPNRRNHLARHDRGAHHIPGRPRK
ncbi:hypothetical protein FB45DRAFT_869052 [Roridomyces roridus]|uniref:Uncharacterized protein n=1 Tax=Roridomyces roridus TaxID=1738132 RepID=A0AAD7BNW7_9AGAR|nr:hypothetical protein FB45DRAFT_869052 [Roridomyces roridus]